MSDYFIDGELVTFPGGGGISSFDEHSMLTEETRNDRQGKYSIFE